MENVDDELVGDVVESNEVDNRTKNLGSFNTAEEASEYRNRVAKKYYGDFYTEIE